MPPETVKTATPRKSPAAVLTEAAIAARTARMRIDPQTRPYRHAVNYRLDRNTPSAKGDYDKRYTALVELVRALDGKPWHYATSSWEIQAHLTSEEIERHLTAPLDVKIDVLVVTPIARSRVFGDPKKLKG
jgi:hypothetical protein